ncbi:MAG: hypothetical protein R2743_25800 [Ilumatobacteraceae bacterium]
MRVERLVDVEAAPDAATDHILTNVLDVRGLTVEFATEAGWITVEDVSFGVRRGETLAIVGESGRARASPASPAWGCCRRPVGWVPADR